MSRRSTITPEQDLLRAQRRGVPNARMWSEAPTPPVVEWDGLESEPEHVPAPQVPESAFLRASESGGGSSARTETRTVNVPTAHSACIVWTVENPSSVDIPAGWTELGRRTVHNLLMVVVGIIDSPGGDHSFTAHLADGFNANGVYGWVIPETSGQWEVNWGSSYVAWGAPFQYRFTDCSKDWDFGFQVVATRGRYLDWYEPYPPIFAPQGGTGFVGGNVLPTPSGSSYTGADNVLAAFGPDAPRNPSEPIHTFWSSGVYMPGASMSCAVGWKA